MGFQRQSGCDHTPLEFLGTPALPVLIIGPLMVITFLWGWLWSKSQALTLHFYINFVETCNLWLNECLMEIAPIMFPKAKSNGL